MEKRIYSIFEAYAFLVTYTLNIEKYAENFKDFHQVKNDIDELLDICKKDLKKIVGDKLDDYLFPLIAFIDEKILLSTLEFKKLWLNNILQKKYFNTLDSGKIFFDRLESFNNTDDIEIKLIYIYFLNLGFKGRYYNNDKYKLEEFHSLNKKFFKEHLKYETNDFFDNSYRKSKLEMPKSINLFSKKSFLFLLIIAFYFILLNSLNRNLNGSLQNLKSDLDKQIIGLNDKIIVTKKENI